MVNVRVGSCFLLAVLAWAASGCAGSGVTADRYALVANPPGLKYVSPLISKQEHDKEFVERYQWTFSPGGWPAADLTFTRMKDVYRGSYSYIRTRSLSELTDVHFPTRKIGYGYKGITRNVLGELEYRQFSVDTVADCVFIEQGISRYSDQLDLRSGDAPLGDMIVRGWYCARSSDPNQDALFREFIASIGIFGFAVPDS